MIGGGEVVPPGLLALFLTAALVAMELFGGLLVALGFLTRSVSAFLVLYLVGVYSVSIGVESIGVRLACGGGFFPATNGTWTLQH